MDVIFGTTEETLALEYIMQSLFDKEITRESAEPILRLVREKKIRIGDPLMYGGTSPIFPEEACSKNDEKIIREWHASLVTKSYYAKKGERE